MPDQVITISPDGSVSGLQRKKGQGFNLQELGHAKTERVSEIVFDETMQLWKVTPIQGPFAGQDLGETLWRDYVSVTAPEYLTHSGFNEEGGFTFYFGLYEDAVAAEVEFLDAARKRGVF